MTQTAAGRRGRLTENVVDSLISDIVSGRYAPGDFLPSEPELGDTYGVSRTVVREAAKIIQDKGLVSVVQGRGSTVRALDEWNSLDPAILASQMEQSDNHRVFDELIVVRLALESEMAAQAALEATPEQVAEMRRTLSIEADSPGDAAGHLEFDVDFHRQVTEASGNRIARSIMASLVEPLRASRRMTSRLPGAEESPPSSHVLILEAIERRDPDRARRTMRKHLLEIQAGLEASDASRKEG